jgi:hypothetical protein
MRLRLYALLTAVITTSAVAQKPVAPMAPATAVSIDESTKLLALNAIMTADPERGVPLVEGILKGNATPSMKDRAMSVLTQSKSPNAQQAVTEYAKSGADPDLQVRAIRYIGRSGGNSTKDTQLLLAGIYPTAGDERVKREIIRSMTNSGASDSLLAIARSEKDPSLRNEAVHGMAASESTPVATLTSFYSSETDPASKRTVISMLAGRGDTKTLIDLARKEPDPTMKTYIVQRLSGMTKNKDAMDFMMELLK